MDAITEKSNLKTLTIDELIGNLKTHKLKKKQGEEKKEIKMENSLALKASRSGSNEQDTDVAYLANRIVKYMRKSG